MRNIKKYTSEGFFYKQSVKFKDVLYSSFLKIYVEA